MAVHCATTSDYLQRTSSLLALTADPRTSMIWVRANQSATYVTGYAAVDALPPGTGSEGGLFRLAPSTNSDLYVQRPAGFFTDLSGNAMSISVYHHLAWTVSGDTHRLYLDGVLQGAPFSFDLGGAPTPAVTNFEVLGFDGAGGSNVDVAYYRSWSGTALSAAQIKAEMVSAVPVITANLWQSNTLDGTYADQSGNGRDWSPVGSPSFTTGPTLVPNAGSVNAIEITSLPYSTSLKISPTGTVNPDVWFKYAAVTGDVVIGLWPFTSLASAKKPIIIVWVDIAGTLVRLSDSVDINTVADVPYSVPVTPGLTYYFDVQNAGLDDASTATFTFSAVAQPGLGVSSGDLMVNDETYGFPLVALDPNTGAVKRHIVYSSGESGDIQPDGTSLAEALDFLGSPIGLQRWDNNFNLVETITYPANFHGEVFHIVTSALGGWFVSAAGADNTHTTVTKFSAAGVAGTTRIITHAASTAPVGVCPSPDDSILYYAVTRAAGAAVQRWDWVGDAAMADIVAGIANYQVQQDIVVLSDGTFVISHYKGTVTRDANVHHYSAAGALLHTYAFGASTLPNRAARASGDPAVFRLWLYPTVGGVNDGTSRYVKVNVSTGALSPDFTIPQYERGNFNTTETATPAARFGPAFSCPFFEMTTTGSTISLPVGGGSGGGGVGGVGLQVFPIRRVRITPTLSSENKRMYHRQLVLDVQAGVGADGAISGQGYDPVVMMRYSDDSGYTWSDEQQGSLGKIGHYGWQVFWERLGVSRNRVYEFVCSDPVNFTLGNAYVTVESGTGVR